MSSINLSSSVDMLTTSAMVAFVTPGLSACGQSCCVADAEQHHA